MIEHAPNALEAFGKKTYGRRNGAVRDNLTDDTDPAPVKERYKGTSL